MKGPFLPWGLAFIVAGVAVGGLAVPYLLLGPGRRWVRYFIELPGATLIAAVVGLVVGLIIASLVSIPFYSLTGTLGWAVPIAISLAAGVGGLWLGIQRERDIRAIIPGLDSTPRAGPANPATAAIPGPELLQAVMPVSEQRNGAILVDTSAIIDGRIADLTVTGFINGPLVVPRFVLDELRHIADSSDSLRRNRGRRGLEVLGRLRKDALVPLQVLDVAWKTGSRLTPGWWNWPGA